VSRACPSWDWFTLTEIYLCHACSHHEVLRMATPGQAARDALRADRGHPAGLRPGRGAGAGGRPRPALGRRQARREQTHHPAQLPTSTRAPPNDGPHAPRAAQPTTIIAAPWLVNAGHGASLKHMTGSGRSRRSAPRRRASRHGSAPRPSPLRPRAATRGRVRPTAQRPAPRHRHDVWTEIYLCNVCSCREMLRRRGSPTLPHSASHTQGGWQSDEVLRRRARNA
jgi:hypothetical protein